MSRFRFYRKWRGGYWIYTHFIGWQKVPRGTYETERKNRLGRPAWSLECYGATATQ
jgi:hypothetical protein